MIPLASHSEVGDVRFVDYCLYRSCSFASFVDYLDAVVGLTKSFDANFSIANALKIHVPEHDALVMDQRHMLWGVRIMSPTLVEVEDITEVP